MNDIKVPPFTDGQKKLIKMTEKLANGRKICDVDDVDDDIKDIKEILKEAITKIENQKQTNFQRISASPEALAEFAEHFANCSDDCPVSKKDICEYKCKKCKEALLAWLKQESE